MNLPLFIAFVTAALVGVGASLIDHDKVQPFQQPEPVTDAEKAAVKFKPSLVLNSDGCHPYPAVNAVGETSAGLKGTGERDGDCKGSELGSQIYSRSMLHDGKWAIMYAWYFPKDIAKGILLNRGVRHRWLSVVVWLDDLALETPTVLATSTQSASSMNPYTQFRPVHRDHMNGTTAKMAYTEYPGDGQHIIVPSTTNGEFQDLIQWEQMTDEARKALEMTDFGIHTDVPFTDANFKTSLRHASTYTVTRQRRHSYETVSMWGA